MLRSLGAVFAVQSVTPTVVAKIMSKVRTLSSPRKGHFLHAYYQSCQPDCPAQLGYTEPAGRTFGVIPDGARYMSAQVPVLVLLQSLKKAVKLLCSASEGQAKHPLLTVTGTLQMDNWRGGGLDLKELCTALSLCHTSFHWQMPYRGSGILYRGTSFSNRSTGVRPHAGIAQVDSKGDGVVDLKELTTALSKWMALVAYPGSRDLIHPFASARDIALDFYIAMKLDPRRQVSPVSP